MDLPPTAWEPPTCIDCAQAGLPGVLMHFVMFTDEWMTVSITEQDSTYRGTMIVRTQRQKVRCALWRCPHGHRQQTAPV